MFAPALALLLTTFVALSAVALGHNGRIETYRPAPGKDTRCHGIKIKDCNTSMFPILDYQYTGWFYHKEFKACRPYYSSSGEANCMENIDIPKERVICEQTCGEPCKMANNEMGICTFNEYCDMGNFKADPNNKLPCGAHGVKCCPYFDLYPKSGEESRWDLGN